jgi:hypothetical protein
MKRSALAEPWEDQPGTRAPFTVLMQETDQVHCNGTGGFSPDRFEHGLQCSDLPLGFREMILQRRLQIDIRHRLDDFWQSLGARVFRVIDVLRTRRQGFSSSSPGDDQRLAPQAKLRSSVSFGISRIGSAMWQRIFQ